MLLVYSGAVRQSHHIRLYFNLNRESSGVSPNGPVSASVQDGSAAHLSQSQGSLEAKRIGPTWEGISLHLEVQKSGEGPVTLCTFYEGNSKIKKPNFGVSGQGPSY